MSAERLGVPSAIRRVHRRELRATLRVPKLLRPGLLDYTVTLSNPYRRPYLLRPCPTYLEYVGDSGGGTERRYRLNCSRVRVIASHGSVTYAMQIRVPPIHTDLAKFGWIMDGGYAPADATRVSVR